ncbi:hypothetical protein ACX4MY_07795, partial [Roseomonas mucosa]
PGAETMRTYRNAILAVAPDTNGLEKAIERIRRLMAAEAIESEQTNSEGGKLAREQLKKQIPELRKATRLEAARAFNRLLLADGAVLTIDERFITPPDTPPMQLPSGQDAVKAFVEDRKLIYGDTDSLFPDRLLELVFGGAVPLADEPEARSASALHRRFLSAQGLRLVPNATVVRASILRAVADGKLAVRQEDGTAFDAKGAVYTTNGHRRRDEGRKLTTLPMDEAIRVAESGSAAAQGWLKESGAHEPVSPPGGLPIPQPPPKGAGPASTTDTEVASGYADKRNLLSLRITCLTAADAQKALGAASPLGATNITVEAELTGDMKDGGKLAFSVAETKVAAAIKPLTMAQTLGNALAPGSSIRVTVVLGFGKDGKADLGALLRSLFMQLPDTATIEARFAPLSA